MKKILSLLSFLMLAVVAMAADLTTGVTFQGTWGDKLGNLGTAEGQMKVTKVDGGLKFEVKSNAFNGFAFPDYTIVYECEVGADGSFNVGNFSRGEITGDATVEGTAVSSLYWQQIKGTVTNESIDLYMRYCGVNMAELSHVTFQGTAVAEPKPEGPTVVSSKSFTDKLSLKIGDAINELPYSAEVTVKEMSDGTNNIDFSFGSSLIEANGLTKGTDAKGRTTYSGDVDVQGSVYKVYAVIYTDADGTEKIYMSVESEGVTYIVGTKPVDGPSIPIENYQADGTGFVVSTPIDWNTQKFQAVIDATNCNSSNTEEIFGFGPEATVWEKNIHIYADKGTYKAFYQCSNGNNNTTVNITDKTNITVEVSKADGLTVDGVSVIAADKLEGLFDLTEVKFGSGENSQFSNALYKSVKLVEVVPPFVPETKTYKDVAYSSFAGTNTNFDENTVEFTTVEDGTYNVVYKNLTVSSNRIGDLNIPNVTATTDADGNVTYATTATEGTWTNINQDLASMLGISEGSPATLKSFTATLSGEKLNMTVVTALTGVDATLVFGEQYVEPNPDPEGTIDVVEHGFNANGFGWQEVKDINWDNQYLKAEMDLTNCTSENEVVLSVGNNITAWGATNFHLYYTAATKTLQYNYIDASGNIGRYDIPNIEGTVTVEISKKNGLVVNGEKCNYKNGSTEQFDDPATAFASLWAVSSVQIGAIQGSTMGYAVYNYIHILPVEAEPVDPNEVVGSKTFSDNLTVGHDAVTGDVTGYANKQVVFTKYANGETAVTFKEYPISETESRDLTFRGTISEVDMSEYGMGVMVFGENMVCKVEDEASSLNGQILYLNINIDKKDDYSNNIVFQYSFANDVDDENADAKSIFYCGRYGVVADAINGIQTEMENGNVSIYTVGGAKVNTLQKGINIVRLANGKTIKVVK